MQRGIALCIAVIVCVHCRSLRLVDFSQRVRLVMFELNASLLRTANCFCLNPFNTCAGHYDGRYISGHNLPAD